MDKSKTFRYLSAASSATSLLLLFIAKKGDTMGSSFDVAIKITLKNEGGYCCNTADPGGETNFGLSKRSYPNLDIKHLTVEQATEIYRRDFWKFDGINDQALANKIFDVHVNLGAMAFRVLQRTLSMPLDDTYNPKVEAAVNISEPISLLAHYKAELASHYRWVAQQNPKEAIFLPNWLRRAAQ